MRAPRVVAAILAALLLSPSVLAAQQLEIGTTDFATESFSAESDNPPTADDYAYGFLSPPFSGYEQGPGSIQSFGVEVATDFGTLTSGTGDRSQITTITVSNNTTTVLLRYESRATRHLLGFFTLDQSAYVNGTLTWQSSRTELHPFSGLRYQTSAILAYSNNDTNAFPPSQGPNVINTLGSASETIHGGALYYLDPNSGGDYFSGKHATRYLLANLSGVVAVTVSTEYPDGLPNALELRYRFEDGDALAVREAGQDCGKGWKNWVRDSLGACPSVAGFLDLLAAGFTSVLGLILRVVVGEKGQDLADFMGGLAQQGINAVVLLVRLASIDTPRELVAWELLILCYAMALGGFTHDPTVTLSIAKGGTKALVMLVVGWF